MNILPSDLRTLETFENLHTLILDSNEVRSHTKFSSTALPAHPVGESQQDREPDDLHRDVGSGFPTTEVLEYDEQPGCP